MISALILASLLVAPPARLPAGPPQADSQAVRRSDVQTVRRSDGGRLAAYLVTFSPGPEVWERFGHNAIWIRDTVSGENHAWDYGRFAFGPGFLWSFARGKLLYGMGREDGVRVVNGYIQRQRSVYLQELDLTPTERMALRDFLDANFAKNHGRYRYDYYLDNCSTRVRDAIDAVTGGRIRATLDSGNSGTTFRWHTRRSLENNLFTWTGADAALGPKVDQPITRYGETFLPGKLREHIRTVEYTDDQGRTHPLVRGEITLAETDHYLVPDTPTEFISRFVVLGLVLGLALFALGAAARDSGLARWLFGFLGGTWALVAGIGGAVLLFLWLGSDHEVAWRNQNLWNFNLLALALVPLLPGALRRNPVRVRPALALAFLLLVSAVLGVIAKGLPGWGQANAEIIALTLPLHAGLALGLRAAIRSPSPSPS
ncbi:MAG TPA: DUF4105 domain-containing protein [Gemmatimonadales bacterium]|nr:DUF4105 domain-containing protein [Gemmatimonadales bacterium]